MADLNGVIVTPLNIIADERGQVMHMVKSNAPYFRQFGEMYFSCIYPGVTKGWKLHTASWSNLAVPIGRVKFVLYDTRENSTTKGQFQEIYLGDNSYKLLTIPPGVAYAWRNLLPETAMVANCASELWSQGEQRMIPFDEVPYQWGK